MTDKYYARKLGEASNSALTEFRKSPLEYWHWAQGAGKPETDPMRLGTAFHMALHEPVKFARKYVTIPDMNLNSTTAKQKFLDVTYGLIGQSRTYDGENAEALRQRASAELARSGIHVLSEFELSTMRSMVNSLNMTCHRAIRSIVARGTKELEIHWTDEASGIQCKARIDSWDGELGIESDLKRTQSIRERDFRRTVLNYGYCYQRAFYRRGLRALGHDVKYQCFVCGSPDAPAYLWAAYDVPEEVLAACDNNITANLMSLAECLASDNWPTINNGEPKTLDINAEWI